MIKNKMTLEDNHRGLKGYCRQTCSIVTAAKLTDNCPLDDWEDER